MYRFQLCKRLALGAAVLCALASVNANAQATRTWVSGVGDDANPCSRTAPCKTFAGAIAKTAFGGEINAIDAGGYGAVTITKSITIDGGGTFASILASGASAGVIVNGQDQTVNGVAVSGDSIHVTLKNLSINGTAPPGSAFGQIGVRVLRGASVTLQSVTIANFSQEGVKFAPSGSADLAILNGLISSTAGGVLIQPGAAATANALIANTSISGSTAYGLRADDRSVVAVKSSNLNGNASNGLNANSTTGVVDVAVSDTVASSNGMHGFLAQVTGGGGSASLLVNNSSSLQNAGDGIRSTGASIVRIAGSTVARNLGTGMTFAGGGQVISSGNNTNQANGVNGAASGNYAVQ